eukprot:12164-Heterococcus_DN1.PRE.2
MNSTLRWRVAALHSGQPPCSCLLTERVSNSGTIYSNVSSGQRRSVHVCDIVKAQRNNTAVSLCEHNIH